MELPELQFALDKLELTDNDIVLADTNQFEPDAFLGIRLKTSNWILFVHRPQGESDIPLKNYICTIPLEELKRIVAVMEKTGESGN